MNRIVQVDNFQNMACCCENWLEFTQELEYLLTCLNFHYSESDYKEHIMDINSQIAIKIDEQLQLHRRAF